MEVVQRLHFMGLRAIENGILRFTNVKVPVENVLWEEGKGLKLALITLNTGRLTIPAGCAAGAKRALEIARIWAAERVQWGAPIGKHDAIAQKLGQMAAEVFAMQSIADLGCLLADRRRGGHPPRSGHRQALEHGSRLADRGRLPSDQGRARL